MKKLTYDEKVELYAPPKEWFVICRGKQEMKMIGRAKRSLFRDFIGFTDLYGNGRRYRSFKICKKDLLELSPCVQKNCRIERRWREDGSSNVSSKTVYK